MSHFIKILYNNAVKYVKSYKNDNDTVKFACFKETRSVTMNIFRKKNFFFLNHL